MQSRPVFAIPELCNAKMPSFDFTLLVTYIVATQNNMWGWKQTGAGMDGMD